MKPDLVSVVTAHMVYFCVFARSEIFQKNARKSGVGRGQFDAGVNGLKKSDRLGTKSCHKRLWDYLGGRRSKQTRGIQCGLILTELQIAIRSRLLF